MSYLVGITVVSYRQGIPEVREREVVGSRHVRYCNIIIYRDIVHDTMIRYLTYIIVRIAIRMKIGYQDDTVLILLNLPVYLQDHKVRSCTLSFDSDTHSCPVM